MKIKMIYVSVLRRELQLTLNPEIVVNYIITELANSILSKTWNT